MPNILLVRHGRSALAHRAGWVRAHEVPAFERAVDAAGIRADDAPPTALLQIAARAEVLVASDLPRAVASVRRLAPRREPILLPSLREIQLEPPRWIPVRLPIFAWDWLNQALWTYRLVRGAHHDAVRRGEEAGAWLADRASSAGLVLAVTHGGFRRILGRVLEARRWKPGGRFRGYGNWSVWSFSR
jgi:broad specificity phosphatase PhoE